MATLVPRSCYIIANNIDRKTYGKQVASFVDGGKAKGGRNTAATNAGRRNTHSTNARTQQHTETHTTTHRNARRQQQTKTHSKHTTRTTSEPRVARFGVLLNVLAVSTHKPLKHRGIEGCSHTL